MRLALLSTFAALSGLGLAVPVAQPSPADIIAVFTSLTSKCQALMAPANQLSVINAPLLLLGSGPWAVPNPPSPLSTPPWRPMLTNTSTPGRP